MSDVQANDQRRRRPVSTVPTAHLEACERRMLGVFLLLFSIGCVVPFPQRLGGCRSPPVLAQTPELYVERRVQGNFPARCRVRGGRHGYLPMSPAAGTHGTSSSFTTIRF